MVEIEHDASQEILTAQYITLRRINDILALLLRNINPDDADGLMTMHEEGIFLTPDPRYKVIVDES